MVYLRYSDKGVRSLVRIAISHRRSILIGNFGFANVKVRNVRRVNLCHRLSDAPGLAPERFVVASR